MNGDLAKLCRSCGLCCDGSLFGRVALEAAELARARKNRLRIVEGRRTFEQPCPALVASGADGHRCSMYAERPRSCRTFECRLFDRHRREGGPLEPRLTAVRRVRELIAYVERLSPTRVDFETEPREACDADADRASQALFELQRRLDEDFARAG